MKKNLNKSQIAAIDYFQKVARDRKEKVKPTIQHILKMSNLEEKVYFLALEEIRNNAQVGLHFHPDRLDVTMKTVAQSLLESGVYKSQFETKISNGSVSATPGGDRDIWEKKLYNGAYHLSDFIEKDRPKYGALNLMKHVDGPAPRFGSCYFLLKQEVNDRCTFTYLDSHTLPAQVGTIEEFDLVMEAILLEIFSRDFVLGENDMTVSKFMNFILKELKNPIKKFERSKGRRRNLNHYVEAQVHGEVSLEKDIDTLVADPSFKGTDVGDCFQQISEKFNIKLYWHSGYAIELDTIPLDFRGPTMPSLAKRIAINEKRLTTKMIGDAAQILKRDPQEWADRGSYEEVLQELKLLWHVLVTFGSAL